jgi:hypothetical protein
MAFLFLLLLLKRNYMMKNYKLIMHETFVYLAQCIICDCICISEKTFH